MSIQTAGPLSCFGGPIGHSARAGVAIIAAPVASMVRRVNGARISCMAHSLKWPVVVAVRWRHGSLPHRFLSTKPPHIGTKDPSTMARVPYLQQSDLPPEHQAILARPIALNRA